MKKLLVFVAFFISISTFSQESKYYLKTSAGLSLGSEAYKGTDSYKGVATDIGIGYDPMRYFGFVLSTNSRYSYANTSSSETNTGLSLSLRLYPLFFLPKHTIDIGLGYGLNMHYWTMIGNEMGITTGSIGRHMYKVPEYSLGYYYSYKKYDLGFVYRMQTFKSYITYVGQTNEKLIYDFSNKQYLISIKKRF